MVEKKSIDQLGDALAVKDTRRLTQRPRSLLAIIKSYFVVVVVFIAFLLFITTVVVIERFLLGWI